MSDRAEKVHILVVDDRPDNLLAITAALDRLGEHLVVASSGREALRHVLQQTFAVILLDINMPGMNGFETAELIRQYRPARLTPILFMTAAGDDALLGRSYSLGAVDYMLTPVVQDVLRGKVRVFVDLFRKTLEIERQAAALGHYAAQLQRLAAASLAIHSAQSVSGIARAVTEAARGVVDTHQAMTTLALQPESVQRVASYSERYAAFREVRPGPGLEALYRQRRPHGGSLRLAQRDIERDAELGAASTDAFGPPRRGLLAVPLTERDGRPMGLIQLSDKREGDFDEGDEAILVQLAQLASIAVVNCLHAEAREANRLKDEFLATLSHELRTPLHALLGWTRLLRTGTPDPARIARGLSVIERNVQLQTSLIDELLDVSRIAAGKVRVDPSPVLLGPIVEGALDALRPAAEAKGIQLQLGLAEDVGKVRGDAERLHQVFGNLIGNAVKFTGKGGRIDVTVRRLGEDVEVQVRDTGVGIRPEFLPFVFDRFRQADSSITRAQGGLGLGLSVVQHLVELHGGSVRAESPGPDQGSTFVVHLPGLSERAVELEASPSSRASLRVSALRRGRQSDPELSPLSRAQTLDGLRVLVVDDDDDARELLREVLEQRRAQVTTASSAREALDALGVDKPHVLVSDVAMQGEDGYELIRRIRRREPHEGGLTPALALTAYARKEDRIRALEAGFQMHATKPIEPMDLVAAVASLANAAPPEPR